MNKHNIIKKALDLKDEQDNLTEDINKANKHFEALRKLEKNQRITPQEQEHISDIKKEYESFFESDSESETNGKTRIWEKNKVEQVLQYLKDEKTVTDSKYEQIANKYPDIFNVLTNKVTNKLHINIKPDTLKSYNESQTNTNLNPDILNTKTEETSKLALDKLKSEKFSDSKANKYNTELDTKDVNNLKADSKGEQDKPKKESISDFLDSLPIDHNPFEDIGGGD